MTKEKKVQENDIKIEVVERLTDADKAVLDLAKAKSELALANAKTALAQSEAAQLSCHNVILQLAIKYHLSDGDTINDDGSIKRKAQ